MRLATEDVEEFDRDEVVSQRRRDSIPSVTLSPSPVLSHNPPYTPWGMPLRSRSHRRRRKDPHELRGNQLEIQDEDMDEIAHDPKPAVANHRKARLVSFNDAADAQILRGSSHLRTKKRLGRRQNDDDDELACVPPGNSLADGSSGLAQKATATSESAKGSGATFEVHGAVCQRTFRYLRQAEGPDSQESGCYLRPVAANTTSPELRAFTQKGEPATQYPWLKITKKAKFMAWNPQSQYIRINQATDQEVGIGSLMVIKLSSSSIAKPLLDAVLSIFGTAIKVVEEDRFVLPMNSWPVRSIADDMSSSTKLINVYDKLNEEINRAIQNSPRQLLRRPPSSRQHVNSIQTPSTAPLPNPPSHGEHRARVSIRSQMQVSGQKSLPTGAYSPGPVHHSEQRQVGERGSRALSSMPSSSRSEVRAQRTEPIQIEDSPAPRRWTEENPEWAKQWKAPLVYNRTTVDKDDIPRLDEGQFLNDNLISFGLRYLFDELSNRDPELNKRVYLHNSFFYTKLKGPRGTINYDSVKNWTAKVDLLAYDYIIVPVNENFHWWVAIICNPGRLDPDTAQPSDTTSLEESDEKNNDETIKLVEASNSTDVPDVKMTGMDDEGPPEPTTELAANNTSCVSNDSAIDQPLVRSDVVDLVTDDKDAGAGSLSSVKTKQRRKSSALSPKKAEIGDPRIITLDSLGQGHSQAVTVLKKYIIAEFEHKRNKIIKDVPHHFGWKAVNIPNQDNFCDCGIYLLAYVQQFVQSPDKFIGEILSKKPMDWSFDAPWLRSNWRDTILVKQNIVLNSQAFNGRGSREPSTPMGTPSKISGPAGHQSRAQSEIVEDPKAKGVSPDSLPTAVESVGRLPSYVYEVPDPEHHTSPQQPELPRKQPTPSVRLKAKPALPPHDPVTNNDNDEVVLLRTTDLEADAVRQSIEMPDLADQPRISSEEPQFLSKLPNSSPKLPEVTSRFFYGKEESSSRSNKKNRSKSKSSVAASSSPNNVRRVTTAAPKTYHTQSRFVISDVPAVKGVEVIRDDDGKELIELSD